MKQTEQILQILKNKFPEGEVSVQDMTGTDDHLEIFISSRQFEGKRILEQHQMVMDGLKASLGDQLHAVKIKTQIKKSEASK